MGCYVQCHCPGWSSALCSFALDSIVDVKTRRQPCAPIVLYRATGLPKGRVVFKRLAGHHFCNRHFCLEGTFPVAVDTKRNLVRMKFFIPFVFLLGELSRPVNELSGHCERLRGQSYSIIASFRYKKKEIRQFAPAPFSVVVFNPQDSVAKCISSRFQRSALAFFKRIHFVQVALNPGAI